MAASSAVKKLVYVYLVLCGIGFVAFGGFQLYKYFGPAKVQVENVPFGLPAGTGLSRGDAPNFDEGIERLPYSTRDEFRRAKNLAENGYASQALEIFDAIAFTYPDLEAAKFESMNALLSLDSLTDMQRIRLETVTENMRQRYPGSSMVAYLDSRESVKSGSFSAALEFARIASDKAEAVLAYRLWYGELLLKERQYANAAEEARAAVSLSLGYSEKAYSLLADVFHGLGQLDSCGSVVEYALTKFPTSPRLLLLQGYLDEYRGHFDSAERTYQRIKALNPGFKAADNALATLGGKTPPGNGLGVSGTPADRARVACDILEPLVQQYPDNLPLKEALGRAYIKGRNFDLAKIQFEEIQNKDPEYPDIQLRLQEASTVRTIVENQNSGLTDNLRRVADSLRLASGPAISHDFSTKLGHYLVRYGASAKEFFSKYSVANFKQIDKFVWQEQFHDGNYTHTYTVLFDEKNRYYGVHVHVVDSSAAGREHGRAPEIFVRLLQQNSRISGIGSATGETECDDGTVLDAAVWDVQDNFEILGRYVGKPSEVRMVRFDKKFLPMGLKLCDYVSYLNMY